MHCDAIVLADYVSHIETGPRESACDVSESLAIHENLRLPVNAVEGQESPSGLGIGILNGSPPEVPEIAVEVGL